MDRIFRLFTQAGTGEGKRPEARVGTKLSLSSFETTCFLTPSCSSYQALESEVQAIRQDLEEVLKEARDFFIGASKEEKLGLRPDMRAEEIWAILSAILDEGDFAESFNALEPEKRKEVAEHVLTRCNVFSGKAAFFSSRYDDHSARLE